MSTKEGGLLRSAAEEECVRQMASANSASYARKSIANGVSGPEAFAEGAEVMRLALPLLRKACSCTLDVVLEGQELTIEKLQGSWLGAQMAAKQNDPSLQRCMITLMDEISAAAPQMSKELNALREREKVSPPSPSPDVTQEQQVLQRILAISSLPAAIDVLRPMMVEVDEDEIDQAAAMLSVYFAQKNLKWADLQALPSTKYGLVMKDLLRERGKRLCVRGWIVQIKVERSEFGTLCHGIFLSEEENYLSYSVAGTSGELIAGDQARLCGVVTGLSSYMDMEGDTIDSVDVVGLFDLPENHGDSRP